MSDPHSSDDQPTQSFSPISAPRKSERVQGSHAAQNYQPLPLEALHGQDAVDSEQTETGELQSLDSEMWYQDAPADFDDDSGGFGAPPPGGYDNNDARGGEERPRRSNTKAVAAVAVIAALVGAGAGVLLGSTVLAPDPTTSDQYLKVSSQKSKAESQVAKKNRALEAAQEKVDKYEDEETGLVARNQKVAVDQQKNAKNSKALKEGQERLKADQEALKKDRKKVDQELELASHSDRGHGSWTVGDDIPEGTYKTKSKVSDTCMYAVFSDSSRSRATTVEYIDSGTPSVTLSEGQNLSATGCGDWVRESQDDDNDDSDDD